MPTEITNNNGLVLLIADDPADIEPIRQALAQSDGWFRLQCVGQVPTALARIAGGGVNVVLLNLSSSRSRGDERLNSFLQLHGEAPDIPIVVLCRAEDESLALRAVRAGAADHLTKERCATDLCRVVHSVVESHRTGLASNRVETTEARKSGTIITFLGGKGGVGTTTVALNVGTALARRNKVIVAELRPSLGTLFQNCRPQCRIRNVAHLLELEPAAIGKMPAVSFLWPYRTVPGLSILFGPQTAESCKEIGTDHAKAILAMLAQLADYVVVDLTAALSEANRAVIQGSDLLVLVVERDPVCVQSAKLIFQTIQSWDVTPQIGAIIMNRTPLSDSVPISEIEIQLGVPTFGTIPPAPDLCLAAQNARTPLVAFDPDSLVAGSLQALAERLANPGQIR